MSPSYTSCLAVKGSVPGTGQSALAGRAGLGDGVVVRQVRWVVGAGARHLPDLPEGYHAAPRAQAWQDRPGGGMACCARGAARSGVARSRRWRFGPRVVGGTEHFRSGPPVRRRLALAPGATNPQLIRHPMTRDGGEAVRSALTDTAEVGCE